MRHYFLDPARGLLRIFSQGSWIMRVVVCSFACAALTQGHCADQPSPSSELPSPAASRVPPLLEVKAGYFFFTDSTMREIYNQGGLDLQLSGSYPVWRWLEIYASVEYLNRSGRSLNGCQKTSIWEIPVNLGLKPIITICPGIEYYLALGPRYFYVHQHNDSCYVPESLGRSGIGLFANMGFNFIVWKHLLIDIFAEYSYAPINFSCDCNNVCGQSAQVGGLTFGAGLGYAF